MTLTLADTAAQLAEAKLAYQERLRATWKQLHDDAERDFEAGFAAGLTADATLREEVGRFEAEHDHDPMLDLRVEDYTGGFTAGRKARDTW